MMIDDERVDQMLYKRILTGSKMTKDIVGFTYVEDALAYLLDPEKPRIDLISLDINMPRMTGFEFLQAVEDENGPDFDTAVVIMLTTSLNPSDRERAKKFPLVKAYANKPLDLAQLAKASQILKDPGRAEI